ncbi:hypothetical protein [Cuneatibacter caecimuris]|uniref:DUF3899 domain-containing protein n=1 Tax=Cuneatibacter caecimuris TaxID=1796618 RepID=A0A4Q7PRK5_9FIRM|nr:hypothetical protein [Cuneatibacter caecimuris]RZT02708.1 hypothetical protein EV209_0832 [Cuneatibacter caecimuris]
MKKFSKLQKIMLGLSLILMTVCGAVTSIINVEGRQEHIGLTIFGLVMFFVFFICAKYPANVWQMSEKQRMRYKTPKEAEDNYRRVMVTMDVGAAVFISILMLLR